MEKDAAAFSPTECATRINKRRFLNVNIVSRYDLCVSCGTCVGVCPTKAISLVISGGLYSPKIIKNKCTNCGLCLRVCPGLGVNYKKLNKFCFGDSPCDADIGVFRSCFCGHSSDSKIRWSASSGGIITTLLTFAFKKGLIDGAIVCVGTRETPLVPKVVVARSEEEIVSAMGSKYCPIPVGVALREIATCKGNFAVVGLPCHLHGIRLAESAIKSIKGKIVLHFGLFCSNVTSFDGTSFLLKKLGLEPEQITSLSYRGHGWPGVLSVSIKKGDEVSFPYEKYWDNIFSLNFFTPWRCLSCIDATSEFADISVGDAWLPQFREEKKGKSIIIVRTKAGDDLLQDARLDKEITITQIDSHIVKNSQLLSIKSKKKAVRARMNILGLLKKMLPCTYPLPQKSGWASYFPAALSILPKFLYMHRHFRGLLLYVPFPLLKAYYRLVSAMLLVIK